MSFEIRISGHGPKEAAVRKVFEAAVQELRANQGEQEEGWAAPSITGSWWTGNAEGYASGAAEDVPNIDTPTS